MDTAKTNHSLSDVEITIQDICSILRQRKWLMGTAESCTGGGIAKLITDLAGVSDVFTGGIVAYSNKSKNQLLDVSLETIDKYGAVSSEVAAEMVLGLVRRLDLHAGISVTGIAGPGGGSTEKPVGLVYIATCVCGHCRSSEHHFRNDRLAVRDQTVVTALNLLQQHLLDYRNK